MDTCSVCRNTSSQNVSFHRFPEDEEQLDRWRSIMGRADGWKPSASEVLCSEHFTPECFDLDGNLLSHALPTLFTSNDLEESEPLTRENESSVPRPAQTGTACACEKRLVTLEKSYKLKLLRLQLQVRTYERELSDQSRKMVKLQRKLVVLQTAAKVLSKKKNAQGTR